MPIKIELNEYDLKLEYVITYTKKHEQYAIAVVVHDKKDHSNALVTMDFLTKKEYKHFILTDISTFIKPETLLEETITKVIVKKTIKSTQDQISKPEITGVLRWQESPTAEKNIAIVKDENNEYWVIVSVTNVVDGDKNLRPTIEEIKIAEAEVIATIISKTETTGPSKDVVE